MGDTYNYAALRDNTVTPLIEKFGVAAKLVRTTKGSYDVADGDYPNAAESELDVTVVIADFDESEIDGTLVKREDARQLIMSGADDAPVMNDRVKIGSDEWEITSVTPIKPGNVVVAYFIIARI